MTRVFGVFGLILLLAGPLEAGFLNGSFEDGLTGLDHWAVSDIDLVSAVGSYDTYSKVDGSRFALLKAGAEDTYTILSQTFTASAGQTLSGYAFFKANDKISDVNGPLPFNDDAYVKILENGFVLFSSSVSAVGNFEGTLWTPFSYLFASGGIYTIEAGVSNVADGDPDFASVLGLDAVQLSLEAVPEPASMIMWSLGVTG